jgi:coenzyme PQQ precursor peptide PqqA
MLQSDNGARRSSMKWTKPKVRVICIALEINDYYPAEY